MKLSLIKETEMPLLLRKRQTYELEFEKATPKKEDIKKEISKVAKAPEELISIRHIYQKYGIQKAKVIAHVYNTQEDLNKIEKINKKKKDGKKESKKQETK
ncbi:MAG: hypothetical protein PHE43_03910 [Candidatus Nanoarchaeia archaeon]|nr:hypothetical protein [Candidatus Nanoarchaeia archaeon]